MKEKLNILFDKCRRIWLSFYGKIDNNLNAAFPEPSKKTSFFVLVGVLEFLLFYLIAVLDVGIWVGDCTPFGIIGGYWQKRKLYPLWVFLLLGVGLLTLMYYGVKRSLTQQEDRGYQISGSTVYGKARELPRAELEKVANVVPKNAAFTTIFGQLDLTENKLITMKPNANSNNNIICFGSPGSGKTFSFVIPFILQAIRRGESILCTDTKGDLWAQTVEVARYYGYTIRRLDFRNPELSDGWDILAELRHSDVRAQVATNIIMENTGNEKDTFLAAESALLKALLLYQERNRAIPESEKTLYNALLLLQNPLETLDKMFSDCKFDEEMKVAYDAYIPFKNGSPNLRGNVINGLFSRLSILTSPPVQHLTSTPDVDMTLPAQRPCIYYCNMSDQHESMRFLGSLFFSFGFLDLVDFADSQQARKCPVRVNFLVEEAMNLGKIPNLSKYLNTCRSRNVDIQLCVQNISQLISIYDDLSESILSACATHLCYGFNDKSTSELFEWRSGEATVKVKTEQHQLVENPILNGFNYSTGDGRRQVYTSNELMTMPARKVFIVWQRQNCLMTHTFGMNRHIEYIEGRIKEISTETHIPLRNTQAKAYLRAMEEQRVMDYENWLHNGGNPWTSYTTPEPQYDGPARGTEPPKVIPYPELERLALEFAAQAEPERNDALLREMQREPEPKPTDIASIPILENVQWDDDIGYGDGSDGFEEVDIDAEETFTADTSATGEPPANDPIDMATEDDNVPPKPADESPDETTGEAPGEFLAAQPEGEKPPDTTPPTGSESDPAVPPADEPAPAPKPKRQRTRKKKDEVQAETLASDDPKPKDAPAPDDTTQDASLVAAENPAPSVAEENTQQDAEKKPTTQSASRFKPTTKPFAGDLGKPGFVPPAYPDDDKNDSSRKPKRPTSATAFGSVKKVTRQVPPSGKKTQP
jgi:type IV secretion system protein VirD4